MRFSQRAPSRPDRTIDPKEQDTTDAGTQVTCEHRSHGQGTCLVAQRVSLVKAFAAFLSFLRAALLR
eukprot:CAMPEP_0206012754 /NCGR_PEP_ID=MMETSP1464-20131121/15365_1 /ASSEMBLY_ACC=CAM_ASM_001124 /TAXON_ID=119497 /ORGANISM="Exanthemachrysis gayraliae, Strain RCC1523" /LENGTH=66 /DNA_ID=CAMNT_0053386449 /DNA_START=318 /DNA_END=518 /DNA_ORIENTATION=-